jgi:Icc-related predicted phosphoesterase
MNIITISDTHGLHDKIPVEQIENKDGSIDMIIHAGDISGRGTLEQVEKFLEWYDSLNFKYKIFIPGNHDFWFERMSTFAVNEMLKEKYPTLIYLHDTNIEIEGLKIHGSGVTPWFHDWAFNRIGSDIIRHWDMIPLDTDILITHGGPKHIGSLNITLRTREDVGCPYLYEKLSELKNLKLFVQGHIHEGRGSYTFAEGQLFINASLLNLQYELVNKPFIIDSENWKIIDF